MGKGKRTRTQRQHEAVRADASYPFEFDARTRQELGEQGLAVLAANLWPKDCQTCGWALGADRPAVRCQDLMVFTQATLHHKRCQPPRWSEDMVMTDSGVELVSYDVLAFMLPSQMISTDGARRSQDWPVLFVNPSLESLLLVSTDTGWANSLLKNLSNAGLSVPGSQRIPDQPVPVATAQLGTGELTVSLSPGGTWSCDTNVPFREAVEDLDGVFLAVTSAAVPSKLQTFDEFHELLHASNVAMGWVPLARST